MIQNLKNVGENLRSENSLEFVFTFVYQISDKSNNKLKEVLLGGSGHLDFQDGCHKEA